MDRWQLEAAIKAQDIIDIEGAIQEAKSSALARSNWEQLVAPAPTALRCLGACFMAGNSRAIIRVTVPKLPGATLDRPQDLPQNLVRCSNLGTEAFLVANKGMAEIYQLSGLSENKVYDVVDLLGNKRAAAKQLPSSFRQLQDNAQNCYETAKQIDDAFQNWLTFSKELWEACQSVSGQPSGEIAKAIQEKANVALKGKDSTAQAENTKKNLEEFGKSLDACRKAFKKASDAQPSGWDLVGRDVLQGIGNACITGLTGIINNAMTSGVPDAAYIYVRKDLYLYDLLRRMVKSTNDDVDWNLASGAAFVESLLTISRESFARQRGGGSATSTYQQVLDDAVKVAGELSKILRENAQKPSKGSESVVRWQTLTNSLYRDAATLHLQSQSQAFSQASSNGALPDPELRASKPDVNSPYSQSMAETIAKNLDTTLRTLESTKNVQGVNIGTITAQTANLTEIQAILARLTTGTIGLEETKEILMECVGLIISLKTRTADLVNFLGALPIVIKTIASTTLSQWLDTVNGTVSGSDSMMKLGGYSLESTERTMIMQSIVPIGSYFSFSADVATSWRNVSEKSIFPGIELAEQLSLDSGDQKYQLDKLSRWSTEATAHITKECGKKRQEDQDNISSRIDKARDLLRSLPAPPAAVIATTNDVLGRITSADIKAVEREIDNSAITILSGKPRTT